MTDDLKNSCTQTTKVWFSESYKIPCFWLKAIPSILVFGLAIFGLFKIVTSAFHYFSEPLSFFDPESLGQLGDFLGGTINPLIGLFTITLLFISISIQRKELKETSDSLKQQNNLLRLEQTRAELIPIMKEYHTKLSELSKAKFDIDIGDNDNQILSMFIGNTKSISLSDIYHTSISTDSFSDLMHELFMNHDPRKHTYFSPIWNQLNELKSLIKKIDQLMIDYISVAQLQSVEKYWFSKYHNALLFCSEAGAISENEKNELIASIQTIRRKFIFHESNV